MLSLSRVAHALLHTAAPVFLASTVVTATSSLALAADNASASTERFALQLKKKS